MNGKAIPTLKGSFVSDILKLKLYLKGTTLPKKLLLFSSPFLSDPGAKTEKRFLLD